MLKVLLPNCPRCNGSHEVEDHVFTNPIGDFVAWGMCPVLNEPVVFTSYQVPSANMRLATFMGAKPHRMMGSRYYIYPRQIDYREIKLPKVEVKGISASEWLTESASEWLTESLIEEIQKVEDARAIQT